MLIADDRCKHGDCADRGVYRMIGYCTNCGAEPVLMLFSAGHEKRPATCPTCGVSRAVMPQHLAIDDDEIPAAAGGADGV